MPELSVDVVVVGAGPTGLMLAAELALGGGTALVLERRAEPATVARANGFAGQILEFLRYRGVSDRIFDAAIGALHSATTLPFGGVHLDFSRLAEPPIWGVYLPQPRLEHLLADYATELGVQIRRGHELIDLTQSADDVVATVDGPAGRYQVTAQYLVGCDGTRSKVRDQAGIGFAGTTYPEVNRLAEVEVHPSATVLDNGDLDVRGADRIPAGFTRTDTGVFGMGSLAPGVLLIQTTEDDTAAPDGGAALTLAELQDSIRRVLGRDVPVGRIARLSRYRFEARQADRYRNGRVFVAGDAAHQFPSTGIGINVGMLDAANLAWKLAAEIGGWAPPGLLDTYHQERHFAGARPMLQTQAQVALRRGQDDAADALRALLLELAEDEQPLRRIGALIAGTDLRYPSGGDSVHPLTGTFMPDLSLQTAGGRTSVAELMTGPRSLFLDLADRPALRETAARWTPRVDIRQAGTERRPADAVLVRPDGYVAWATGPDMDDQALQVALTGWLGEPGQ